MLAVIFCKKEDDNMQIMHLIPRHACPYCGSIKGFLVRETRSDYYLTNRDGEIEDTKDIWQIAVGKCLNCGAEMEMYSVRNTFIPLTPLRKMLVEYEPTENQGLGYDDEIYIRNPFLKERGVIR